MPPVLFCACASRGWGLYHITRVSALKLVSLVENVLSVLSTNAPLQFTVAPSAETHRWSSSLEVTRRPRSDVVSFDWPRNSITSSPSSALFRLSITLQSLCVISKAGVDWISEKRERVEQLLTTDGMLLFQQSQTHKPSNYRLRGNIVSAAVCSFCFILEFY